MVFVGSGSGSAILEANYQHFVLFSLHSYMYNRMGQIVTKIGNVRKKNNLWSSYFTKRFVKEAIKKKINIEQMACEFAWICKYLQTSYSPNFKSDAV